MTLTETAKEVLRLPFNKALEQLRDEKVKTLPCYLFFDPMVLSKDPKMYRA